MKSLCHSVAYFSLENLKGVKERYGEGWQKGKKRKEKGKKTRKVRQGTQECN